MHPRHFLSALLVLASLIGSTWAEESLTLLPERPKVGETFQVVLQPAPTTPAAAGQYTWSVQVLDEEQSDITPSAAPAEFPNAAVLTLPAIVANAQYKITLKIKSPTPRELTLTAESGGTRLAATGIAVTAMPPMAAAPMPAETAPPAADSLELRKMGQRLEAAKQWARQVAVMPKSESLVLPVEFFQQRLAKRADGKEGILEFAHRPILDAMELHRAMMAAANQFPAETDVEQFIDAWHEQKEQFLRALPERNAATALIVELWKEFADAWEEEVLKEDRGRFREGLIQAPLVILGLLLEFDERHIQAAMTGEGVSRTSSTGGSTFYGGGVYSHAAVHHARAMSRIHYRHGRRMVRLGY